MELEKQKLEKYISINFYHFIFFNKNNIYIKKAKQLEYFLHQQISPKQVIMASTPMQELSSIYSQQKVLIVSGDQQFSHEIGKLYGFQNITTIEEYLLKHQILYPHKTYPPYEQQPLETEEPITSIFLMQVPS